MLNLALQGGGAHGAYTWGVLDCLLEREDIDIGAVSGASAGAMNAVVLAQGWLTDGRDGARTALNSFWGAVSAEMPPGFILPASGEDWPSLNPMARAMLRWTELLTPRRLILNASNPLRDLLAEHVDFAALRGSAGPRLFVAATHANTGRLRIFRREELTLQAVMASACLPNVHPTVVVDGEPYWDGAFSANPPLAPLLFETRAKDVLIVMLSPLRHDRTPLTAAQVRERTLDIAFNATFLREVQWLGLAQLAATPHGHRLGPMDRLRGRLAAGRLGRRVSAARFHLVALHDADRPGPAGHTRMLAHRPFLERLRDTGRADASRWLDRHAADIGRRSTVDLLELLSDR